MPTPSFRGFPACSCLVAWLTTYEALLRHQKVIGAKDDLRIFQLIGGAAASAGTHSTGGAFDIDDYPTKAVALARQMGADATWLRTVAQGFSGPHIHGVLRGCPHNSPARYQIDAVDAGYNGLGSGGRGGKDTGPRPLSGRTWDEGIRWAQEKMGMRRLVVANSAKQLDGDAAYLAHLKQLTKRGALIRQEVGRGLNSVRITPVGIKVRELPLWVVGRFGAHRGVARSWMRIDGELVRVFNVHGLHNKTVGTAAHDRHLNRIARQMLRLNGRGIRWVVGGDFNESVTKAAERMGGRPHGTGIVGFVVSPGLRVVAKGSDYRGKREGWTDHPAYWIDLKTN